MITRGNVSFSELGWEFSYDKEGKYPLRENENIPITPNQTIVLYFRNRPVQEADGYFYGTAVESGIDFPLFFFNMMKKIDKKNTIYLFGKPDVSFPSLKGKIESFSLWSKELDDAAVLNYQTNTMKMIGDGVEYNYQTIEEAKDDGLKLHYEFDDNSSIVNNFAPDDSNVVKVRRFDISTGKTVNSSVLDRREDYLFLEKVEFYSEFTMNFRFYVEDMEDFVLFYSKNIGFIRFDVVTSTFEIEFFPHVGNAKTAYVQQENLQVHKWYDLSVSYKDGVTKSTLNGEFKESNVMGLDMGGVYSLLADNSNFETISIDSTYTFQSFWRYRSHYPHNYHGVQQPATNFTYSHGRDELFNMMIGENRDMSQSMIMGSSIMEADKYVNDTLTDDYTFNYYFYGASADTSIRFRIYKSGDAGLNFQSLRIAGRHNSYSNRAWTSMLVPQGYVKVTLIVKDSIISNDAVFPVISLIPGLPVSTYKVKMNESTGVDFNVLTGEEGTVDHAETLYAYVAYRDERIASNVFDATIVKFTDASTLHYWHLAKGAQLNISYWNRESSLLNKPDIDPDLNLYQYAPVSLLPLGLWSTTISECINLSIK